MLEAVKKSRSIFIVEGEKDVHTLESLGLVATTNSGDAGKWKPDFSLWLHNAEVIIIPDNDDPGRSHAKDIVLKLYDFRSSGPAAEAEHHRTDWIKNGGTKDRLYAIYNYILHCNGLISL